MLGQSPAADRPVGVAVATPYLPELESLRGIAIVLVLLFHLDSLVVFLRPDKGRWVSPFVAYVQAGHTGVNLFFILSGFLLSMPFLAQAAGGRPVSLRRYAGRRALRILPLYYSAVLVAALLCASTGRDLLRALPYLCFLNGFADATTPLPPYSNVWWSLATEAQFYVLLPLLPLTLGSPRRRIVGAVALMLIVAAYAAFLSRILQAPTILGEMALGFSVLGRAPMFLAGIGAAWFYLHHGASLRRRLASRPLRSGGADLILLAVLAVLAGLLRWVVSIGLALEQPNYQIWHVLESVLWTAVMLLLLLAPLHLKPLLSNPLLRRLGVLSYSLYLLHVPVIITALNFLRPRIDGLVGWNSRTALAALAICLGCVGMAELTYRGIERPFLVRKERLRV
jgi:peptidoglycan/LPS O-acetylase OafA/YrhL